MAALMIYLTVMFACTAGMARRWILIEHNTFALQNDDVLIPVQVRHGKALALPAVQQRLVR